jgi:hypothetical protein
MLNKTLSNFLCVQGLIFLSTGAKRAAQRQHWHLGVRGLTTIQQGSDFIVHLRYQESGWRWREVEQLTIVVVDHGGSTSCFSIVLAIGKEPWTLFHTFARFRRLIIWNLQLAAAPYIYKSYWCFGRFLGCWRGMVRYVCPMFALSMYRNRHGRRCFFRSFPFKI